MQYPLHRIPLYGLATVALLVSVFWLPLAFAAMPLYLVAAVLRVRDHRRRERIFLWVAVMFSVVALIGLFVLQYYWRALDYGLFGYLILFLPFTAVIAAVGLALGYLAARRRRHGEA